MPRFQTPAFPVGQTMTFPKYGDDTNLLFRHPLTTLASADELETALGYTNLRFFETAGGSQTTKRNVIDPTLGMRSTSSDGTIVCPSVDTPVGTSWSGTDGDSGFVISLEIETNWIVGDDFGGHDSGSNETLIGWGPSSVGDCRFMKLTDGKPRLDMATNNNINTLFQDWIVTAVNSTFEIIGTGKGTHVTVQMGFMDWFGTNRGFLAIDGMVIKSGLYDGAVNAFNYMSFFSQQDPANSTPSTPFTAAFHIRNLQVSTLPAGQQIPQNYTLGHVVGFGDSIRNDGGYDLGTTTTFADAGWPSMALKTLIAGGTRWKSFRVTANGGGYGIKEIGSNLDDLVPEGTGNLFDAAEKDPDTVILFCGTNDGPDFAGEADYITEYLELLDLIFGTNAGGARTSVSNVFCIVPPPRSDVTTQQRQDDYTTIRGVVRKIEALWDAHQPSLEGRVVVGADYEAILGADLTNWEANWDNDDKVHPNPAANAEMGPYLGAKMLSFASIIRRNLIT